jgi:hypothetical protein
MAQSFMVEQRCEFHAVPFSSSGNGQVAWWPRLDFWKSGKLGEFSESKKASAVRNVAGEDGGT